MPRAARRSSSCSAALRLKASMRMPDGSTPRSTSSTTRLTRVLVLPEPAGASTRAAPRSCSTAARWASSSRTASGPVAARRAGAGASAGCECAGRGSPGWSGSAGPAVAPRSRPMSSRSSREASPTPRLRGASSSGPKGKPRQNGAPRATSGCTKRSSTSPACAASSPTEPSQCQSPAGGSPPSKGRRGSPGSSVHERRKAKRIPGAAAAARCASSRRPLTWKNTRRGSLAGGLSAAAVIGWPAGPGCFARPATDASSRARQGRG